MNTERREATRIQFKSTVRLFCTDGPVVTAPLETEDISLKGIFIKCDQEVPPGTECTVEVDLSGNTSTMSISAKGTVVRQGLDGIAVSFSELNPDSYAHIQNLIILRRESRSD